jgi:hypothetical protein
VTLMVLLPHMQCFFLSLEEGILYKDNVLPTLTARDTGYIAFKS